MMKGAAATGAAATGVAALGGQVTAQRGQWIPVDVTSAIDETTEEEVSGAVDNFEDVEVLLRDVDEETASGRIRGRYFEGESNLRFNERFSGVPIDLDGENGEQVLIDIVIENILIDILGLIVDVIAVEIQVRCDPEGGLLGRLLCDLLA